jgi:hypothetical protein
MKEAIQVRILDVSFANLYQRGGIVLFHLQPSLHDTWYNDNSTSLVVLHVPS